MFKWLRRFQFGEAPRHLDPDALEEGDWVVVPYRLAEACRISMYTIASHPDVQDNLKRWIVQWLDSYNAALATWFTQNYGAAVFPVLADITNGVRAFSEQHTATEAERLTSEAFQRWEQELEDNGERP